MIPSACEHLLSGVVREDRPDSRHLRAEGRLPECWIPPSVILECRALLETYHDLRAEHTAWVQRIHAVFFHQGGPALGEAALRTGDDLEALRAAAAAHLSLAMTCWLGGAGRFSSSRKISQGLRCQVVWFRRRGFAGGTRRLPRCRGCGS